MKKKVWDRFMAMVKHIEILYPMKYIPGSKGYFTTKHGIVYRLSGVWNHHYKFIPIKPALKANGYCNVTITFLGDLGEDEDKPDYQKTMSLHALIANQYLGPKPHKDWEVDHKDRIRWHNEIENLRWLPRAENRSRAKEPYDFEGQKVALNEWWDLNNDDFNVYF